VFLYNAVKQYQSFSIATLAEIFESDKKDIIRFVSKLILSNKLEVHIDED